MNILRQACIREARQVTQDCLVIGAGINGAVAAAALAGRSVQVTVIDKGDFASCTSQESSNLAWGGIKYLENYEFDLVRKLCESRNRLMQAYPNQVREIRFFTSIAKGFRKPRIVLYCGALLYWFMGRCQTKPPRLLSRRAIRRKAPMVNTDPLAGGMEYSDAYFVENDARFTFGFIRWMIKLGGNAINYTEMLDAEWRNGCWHCMMQDNVNGAIYGIIARTLINAAGPLADRVNALLGIDSKFKHLFSKGAHIIVPQITETQHVLTFFASDGRLFFMIPMGGQTCIGTTDTRVTEEEADPTTDDIDFLLNNANALLKLKKPLSRSDVIATRCGVRPLAIPCNARPEANDWMTLSRKHAIDLQRRDKVLSIYGGKLTDCLNVGEEVVERIASLGIPLRPEQEWYGEEPNRPKPMAEEKIIGNLGRSDLERIAREEMVMHLEDFLRRRTMLELTIGKEALRNHPGLPEAAQILFGDQADVELDRYWKTGG
jgi:glycerol-3-phosphate dehydrogenase